MTTITYPITHNGEEIEIECTGQFYDGDLEDFYVEKPYRDVDLTLADEDAICRMLVDARADEWDEDSYKERQA